MHTRSQSRNLHNQQHQAPPPVVEPFNLEEPFENPPPPPPPMDDQRTMAQLLEAPTAGYEDAIVVPEITADNFELKHGCSTYCLSKLPPYQAPAAQIQMVYQRKISKLRKDNDACEGGTCKSRELSLVTLVTTAKVDLKILWSSILSLTPRVPLILGRSFLKTSRALIDVYEGKITLRVGREAITFNLDQTSRYTANYNHMTANRIDVIDMACEEYSQEVLGFSNVISSGNPTPYYDPIVSTVSPTLTPFGDSDFLLFEEADSFLAIEDDPTSPEVDPTYYDPDGDILLLEAILNSDPSPPPPNQGNYFPETRKDLKICEANNENSSVNEPPEVELKDLPPHLEYAFLEGNDKLPVIIAKDLKNEEKAALIEVLKSHKRAIAWKLSDIKGINPEFCTHKILMEEDYEPTVQHQRRVNPKIHDVIKKEVEKLLDAGLIYPISDSPWVSPVHCVPKKGGMTVVKNDENDLIPTRLVTGWRERITQKRTKNQSQDDKTGLEWKRRERQSQIEAESQSIQSNKKSTGQKSKSYPDKSKKEGERSKVNM
ncbi:hypothetical protein Tco_1264646 [Tanacetum coccineum]